ncbi:3-ketosphinganine reductase [Scheffersomyces xylosifermentans]|uniref:3-ketosphinganine reductase n=1 Tax=Scheffersomyces xylosifermentans TaxID=1304137 RepID=UPI00315D4F27
MWFSKSHFKPNGKTALVVGASQGLGVEIALKLYQQNCTVILVARTAPRLQQQVKRIQNTVGETNGATASYIACDVSDYNNCVKLWDEIVQRNQDPDFIFCCAGSSIPKLFNDLSGEEISSGVTVNYNTAVNVVHTGFKQVLAANPELPIKQYKKRHIILFSSVVSFFPFIGYAQYAPMKAAIQSLSLILRQELGPYNYRVSCVFPGNFQSEGYTEEQKTKPEITKTIEGPSVAIGGDECAEIVLDKLSKGYDTVTTDFVGWLLGSSVLGTLPRCWGFFQVIMSLIFSIVEPIALWVVFRDIAKYFDNRKKPVTVIEEVEESNKDK